MKRLLPIAVLAGAMALPAAGQCVMCYLSAHSQNAARARVLDTGIVLLGVPPIVILAGFIAFVFSQNEVGQRRD